MAWGQATLPLLRFAAGRLLAAAFVVLGALVVLFALTLAIPGNPAQVLLGPQATPETIEAFSRAMGLDRPAPERLGIFLGQVLRGNLGTDALSGRPILDMVLDVLPYTAALAFAAVALAVLIGVPLGALAARRPGGVLDQVGAALSVGFVAIPAFVVAVALLLVFSTWLGWLPVLGAGGGGWQDTLLRLVLPAVALALGWIGYLARLLRASMLDALAEVHAQVARAFGIREQVVVLRYALRLAAIPAVAVMGAGFGRLLGGAVFVEVVFARPGLGTLAFDAIGTRNYPVVQAAVLVIVALFAATSLVVDLLLVWLDPRIGAASGNAAAGGA